MLLYAATTQALYSIGYPGLQKDIFSHFPVRAKNLIRQVQVLISYIRLLYDNYNCY